MSCFRGISCDRNSGNERHDDLFRARLDQINAVMSAVGYNIRLILKWLSALLRAVIAAFLGASAPNLALKTAS
ncbi:MAG: hypothetical protein AAF414_11680 [Pseudomonadota bacterium]